ncbi:hypothetical protein [Streptomyces sp. NPDC055287]
MQHVTSTGTALAVALLPLAVGVLLAKTMAGDPLAPVNALITSGGQRARISPSEWRRCGRTALSKWKTETRISGADSPGRAWRRTSPAPEAQARAYADLRRPGVGKGLRGIERLRAELQKAQAAVPSAEL